MDKLKALLSHCKCGVFLYVNEHRDYYTTAQQFMHEAYSTGRGLDAPEDVIGRMIETDTTIRLVFFPDTPGGSYEIWHFDLEAALDAALACFAKGGRHERT